MALTKIQILSELNSLYKSVEVSAGNPELIETVGAVKKYLFHHLDTGLDQDGAPIAHKAFKVFYVWKEGVVGEEAFYEDNGATSFVDKTIANITGKLVGVARLFSSSLLRTRVRGAIVKLAVVISQESAATANHSQRMKWAVDALTSDKQLNLLMASLTDLARVKDGSATDINLENAIAAVIDVWALAQF